MNKHQLVLLGLVTVTILFLLVVFITNRNDRENGGLVDEDVVATESNRVDDSNVIRGEIYSRIFSSDDRERQYFMYIPTGYKTDTPAPLVLFLHGGGGATGVEDLMTKTGMKAKAESENFILVAPLGVDGNWNDGRGTTNRSATAETVGSVDDVAFLSSLIEKLQTDYALDANQIFAVGISNGSMMSQRLACDAPGLLAGVGAVSGPHLSTTPADCDGATSIISINGTDDPFYPMMDSDGIPEFPRILQRSAKQTEVTVAEISNLWVTKNQCDTTPAVTPVPVRENDGTSVTKYEYENCQTNNRVEYYIVEGMGHTWPPNTPPAPRVSGGTSQNIIATDVIWEFFVSL